MCPASGLAGERSANPRDPATGAPMQFTYHCPACRNLLEANHQEAGQKVQCPTCAQKIRIPPPPSRANEKTILGEVDEIVATESALEAQEVEEVAPEKPRT